MVTPKTVIGQSVVRQSGIPLRFTTMSNSRLSVMSRRTAGERHIAKAEQIPSLANSKHLRIFTPGAS